MRNSLFLRFVLLSASLTFTITFAFTPSSVLALTPPTPEQKPAPAPSPAEAVTSKVDLLDVISRGDIHYHLNPGAELTDKPEDVFQIQNGELHISGKGYGCLYTNAAYKDYRLVLEFKWTGQTWGRRETRARDSGLLLHCHGPTGAYSNTWTASIEAQLIEGGMGDILVLSPKLPDGTVLKTTLDAEIELDRDKEKRWKKGAPRQTVETGRINWEKRDEDWADKVGFRGKDDPDAPLGEWNTLEVIAKGDTLQYFFNGKLVNEGFAAKPSEGRIGIQTEAAGLVVRKYELLPLGDEKNKAK